MRKSDHIRWTDKGARKTYVTQLAHNLPHPTLVHAGDDPAVLLKEDGEVAEVAQLRLDEQLAVLLPSVDKLDDVRMCRG